MKFQYVLHKVDRELERNIRRTMARKVVLVTKRIKQVSTEPATMLENQENTCTPDSWPLKQTTMSWRPYIKGFKAYLLLERALADNTIEAW